MEGTGATVDARAYGGRSGGTSLELLKAQNSHLKEHNRKYHCCYVTNLDADRISLNAHYQ